MKSKVLQKKLMLNKKTVVNLNGRAMNQVKGGVDTFYETCFTCATCLGSECPVGHCPTTTYGGDCQ